MKKLSAVLVIVMLTSVVAVSFASARMLFFAPYQLHQMEKFTVKSSGAHGESERIDFYARNPKQVVIDGTAYDPIWFSFTSGSFDPSIERGWVQVAGIGKDANLEIAKVGFRGTIYSAAVKEELIGGKIYDIYAHARQLHTVVDDEITRYTNGHLRMTYNSVTGEVSVYEITGVEAPQLVQETADGIGTPQLLQTKLIGFASVA